MKKLVALTAALVLSTAALAHGPGMHHGGGYRHGGWGWTPFVAGALVTGTIYELTHPVIVSPPAPVMVQPTYAPVCQSYVPVPPFGYHYVQYFDGSRGCTSYVLTPN